MDPSTRSFIWGAGAFAAVILISIINAGAYAGLRRHAADEEMRAKVRLIVSFRTAFFCYLAIMAQIIISCWWADELAGRHFQVPELAPSGLLTDGAKAMSGSLLIFAVLSSAVGLSAWLISEVIWSGQKPKFYSAEHLRTLMQRRAFSSACLWAASYALPVSARTAVFFIWKI